jgi:hypothetical protein
VPAAANPARMPPCNTAAFRLVGEEKILRCRKCPQRFLLPKFLRPVRATTTSAATFTELRSDYETRLKDLRSETVLEVPS